MTNAVVAFNHQFKCLKNLHEVCQRSCHYVIRLSLFAFSPLPLVLKGACKTVWITWSDRTSNTCVLINISIAANDCTYIFRRRSLIQFRIKTFLRKPVLVSLLFWYFRWSKHWMNIILKGVTTLTCDGRMFLREGVCISIVLTDVESTRHHSLWLVSGGIRRCEGVPSPQRDRHENSDSKGRLANGVQDGEVAARRRTPPTRHVHVQHQRCVHSRLMGTGAPPRGKDQHWWWV